MLLGRDLVEGFIKILVILVTPSFFMCSLVQGRIWEALLSGRTTISSVQHGIIHKFTDYTEEFIPTCQY